jgi:hypothetical protein
MEEGSHKYTKEIKMADIGRNMMSLLFEPSPVTVKDKYQ